MPSFYAGERKINIIHAQMRMKCSNLNSDLYDLHVKDNPSCMYCNQIEDANHFFLSCPMYTVEREQMIDTIHQQIDNIDINTILYGNESISIEQNQIIFQTVHEYIKNSGRFTNVV